MVLVRPLLLISVLVGLVWGCDSGGTSPSDADTDAGLSDAGDGGGGDGGVVVDVLPPTAPTPVDFGVCRAGWRAHDGVCDPWPVAGASMCPVGEAHFPGTPGCARVGTACPPPGQWVEGLSPTETRYVREGATGGDGTREAPFGRLGTAVLGAAPGTFVALSAGTYDTAVRLPVGVTLIGACPEQTVIAPSFPSDLSGAIIVEGHDAVVQNLRLGGERPGLSVDGDASVRLIDVVVHEARSAGLLATRGGVITGDRVVVQGTRPRAGTETLGRGISVEAGARATFNQLLVADNHELGVMAAGAGTDVLLMDAAILRTRSQPGDGRRGRGLNVNGGASASVLQGVVEDNREYGVFVTQEGSRLSLEHVVVRRTGSEEGSLDDGLGVAIEQGSSATLDSVWVEDSRVVGVSVVASTLDAHGLVVGATAAHEATGDSGFGLSADRGAVVSVEGLRVSGSATVGVAARDTDTLVSLTDARVTDTRARESDGVLGTGIGAIEGARVELLRVEVEAAAEAGVRVHGVGSTARLVDLSVISTGRPTVPGHGLQIGYGAVVDGQRLRLEDSAEIGLAVGGEDAVATLTDVTVRGASIVTDAEDITYASGVQVEAGGSLVLARALVEDCALRGVSALGMASLTLRDAVVRDTREHPDGGQGRGLIVADGVSVEVSDTVLSGNHESGIAIFDPATVVTLRDVTVQDTLASTPEGDRGRAISVDLGAQLTMARVRLLRNREVALWVSGEGTEVSGDFIEIRDTRAWDCAAMGCAAGGVGLGVYAGAHAELTEFTLTGADLCGAQVARDGALDLHSGLISDHPIGVNIQVMGFDFERVTDDVRFEDNGRNVDTDFLPVPETGLEETPRMVADPDPML